MYRKEADRKIVRDVRLQLGQLREKAEWADWQMAVTASMSAHPSWYKHHMPSIYDSVEPLLREAGIDMSDTEKPFRLVGNMSTGQN